MEAEAETFPPVASKEQAAASDEGCEVETVAPAPADLVEGESNGSSSSDDDDDGDDVHNAESDEPVDVASLPKSLSGEESPAKEDATPPVADVAGRSVATTDSSDSPPKLVVTAKTASNGGTAPGFLGSLLGGLMTSLPTISDVGSFPGGDGDAAAATAHAGADGSEPPEVGGDAVRVPTSNHVDDKTVSTENPAVTEEAAVTGTSVKPTVTAVICSKCKGPVPPDEWPEASSISSMTAAKTAAAVAALASLLGYLSM